jgi:hypothetical protein
VSTFYDRNFLNYSVLIANFSQGAQVTHNALRMVPAAAKARIAGVVRLCKDLSYLGHVI